MSAKKETVEVFGGGFSGMVAAYHLAKRGHTVDLYEKSDRLGGLLGTEPTRWGIAERAANGLLNSPLVEELFTDLKLQPAPKSEFLSRKFIYRNGKPQRWPLGFSETGRLLLAAPGLISKKSAPTPGESLAHWGRRVLGQGASQFLLETGQQGIYAGDPEQLSATLILRRFFHDKNGRPPARSPKKKLRFGRGTVVPVGGMVVLLDALEKRLKELGVGLHLSSSAKVHPQKKTVMAGPAPAMKLALKETAPELAGGLSQLNYLPLVSVTLFWRAPSREPLRGFGCLFPPSENFHSLGVIFRDGLFQQDSELVAERWIMGGVGGESLVKKSEAELVDLALEDMKRLYSFTGGSLSEFVLEGSSVVAWPAAVPHYTVDLEAELIEFGERQKLYPQTQVFGNYLGFLGLTQILERAEELAVKMEKTL